MAPSCPTSEHASSTTTSSPSSPAYSAWAASSMRARSRASIRIACWNPPHVPRNGICWTRAARAAWMAPSRLSYGLPGTTQMPSKPSRFSCASVVGTQYGSSTTPSRRRRASISCGMRAWARTLGERSPTRAMVGMPGMLARGLVHVQRSFAVDRSAILIGVDPRFLRTFAAVVRLESFSAAARELGYTQSAVSQHIAALEADLGFVLLHRRPVAPTEAGTRLLEHGGAILLRLDAARADVMRGAAGAPPPAGARRRPVAA